MNRRELLEAEFIRPPFPGLRKFGAALLTVARALRLQFALPKDQRRLLSAEESALEETACAWLMDAAVSVDQIRDVAALGRDRFFAEILPDYAFSLSPAKLALVKKEIEITNEALQLAMVLVQPKPDSATGPTPPGN